MATSKVEVSIVALDRFIEATRDSGYKSTVNAVAELVDNSLQAGAKNVDVRFESDHALGEHPIGVTVVDDGCGMDRATLRQALRFGGSSRFNDRAGLGRFGMGLPNASLSQARRVDVFTWQGGKCPIWSYLDVDEIVGGDLTVIPSPRSKSVPSHVGCPSSRKGTAVLWTRCDRLDHRRPSTLAKKLHTFLGRMFRYFIWDGITITVNDKPVEPLDPLYVAPDSKARGGKLFQDPLEFEIRSPQSNGRRGKTGRVVVTFAELPVREWHTLSREEKRHLGVTNGAGVSVVRGGREIDYGWFFLRGKRRENYDDWWRCEVKFEPVLDEAFGITHTKQQIRPCEYLEEVLAPEMEVIAKALNARVRRHHLELKCAKSTAVAETVASERDHALVPLSVARRSNGSSSVLDQLVKRHPMLAEAPRPDVVEYRIIEDEPADTCFYRPVWEKGRIVLLLNRRHEFFKRWYSAFAQEDSEPRREAVHVLQMLLLAAARAEAQTLRTADRRTIEAFRQAWSDTLNVFLGK